jgi:hypothetical protein
MAEARWLVVIAVAACASSPAAAPANQFGGDRSRAAGELETARIAAWWAAIANGKLAETAWPFTARLRGVGDRDDRCTGDAPVGPDCLTPALVRIAPPRRWQVGTACDGASSLAVVGDYCGYTTIAGTRAVVEIRLADAGVASLEIAVYDPVRGWPRPAAPPSLDARFSIVHARLSKFRDDTCRCRDHACMRRAADDMTRWNHRWQHDHPDAPPPDAVEARSANAVGAELAKCMDALTP